MGFTLQTAGSPRDSLAEDYQDQTCDLGIALHSKDEGEQEKTGQETIRSNCSCPLRDNEGLPQDLTLTM